MGGVITLLTDFGTKDYFVAEMKAVILKINPKAIIVDITHDVEKYNIMNASFILACAYKWFPKGTVHVVVVDPGVGTPRRGIAIKTKNYYFVGPDNGVLMMAALKDGIEKVVEITNKKYMLGEISTTFHGRDIFAPVAAYISLGISLDKIGKQIHDYIIPNYASPKIICKNKVEGLIIHIDSFGNIITNINKDIIEKIGLNYYDNVRIIIGNHELITKFLPSYGYAKEGDFLTLIDSENFFEISINKGSAARILKVNTGDKVIIEKI